MIGTIIERDLDIHHGIAGNHAILHGFLGTLVHSANIFPGHYTAHDIIYKFVTCTFFLWLKAEIHMAVLAAATGLTHELAFLLDLGPNGFTVSHLWRTDIGLDTKLALHAVDNDFQVQLAHAGNDSLSGFFICSHAK